MVNSSESDPASAEDSQEPSAEKPPSPWPNDTLAKALQRHHILLPEEQVAKLDEYCQLLWQWNEKINLTRHTDYDTFTARDVLDTVELAKHLKSGEEVLDVGTGGGVPGFPLALIRPDLQVSLCESIGKKAEVVDSMVL